MNDRPDHETRLPDFVDEVDSLQEFHDAPVSEAEKAAFVAANPRPKPQPREATSDGRVPDFVDVVDSLDEFVDAPFPSNDAGPSRKSTATPPPTLPTNPSDTGTRST